MVLLGLKPIINILGRLGTHLQQNKFIKKNHYFKHKNHTALTRTNSQTFNISIVYNAKISLKYSSKNVPINYLNLL